GLLEPSADLDCGNSGTSLRLFAGILAGLPFRSVLDGDDSLRRRPVARIIEPLRSMGATMLGRSGDSLPPLTVIGRHPLRAIDHLRAMGADVEERPVAGTAMADNGVGEPIADLHVRSSQLRGIEVDARAVATAIDEIPILCLAAATAAGETTIRGAGELRHKE